MKKFTDIVAEAKGDKGSYEAIKYFAKLDPAKADELRQRYYAVADNMQDLPALINSLNGETGEFGKDQQLIQKVKKLFDQISLGKFI